MLDELRKELETNGLRLVSSVYNKQKRVLKLRFVTPEKLSADEKKAITDSAEKLISEKSRGEFKVEYSFEKDYMDCDTAKDALLAFFEENFTPALPPIKDTLTAQVSEDGVIELKFTVNSEVFALFKQMDVVNRCNRHFESVTSFKVAVKADVVRAETDTEALKERAKQRSDQHIAKSAFRPQRTINVENVTEYIGKGIFDRPRYIIDALEREEKYVTVCGSVQSPREVVTASGYTLFKFDVKDHTALINVVMFPKEDAAMLKKLKALNEGEQVLLNGLTEHSSYSHAMEFKAFRLSKCVINEPDYLSQKTRAVPENYVKVFEEDYAAPQQSLISDTNATAEKLKGQSFVVFDFETTGTDIYRDKVIELGAVKIVDGVITKTFSTPVNPERPIPKEITELTGITDKDVEKAPVFEEIIGDFYKFAYGCPLVAHNIDFDFGLLYFNTKDSGYIFAQKQYDTMTLARKFFNRPSQKDNRPKDNKLATLVAHMGVDCPNAHRALGDATATAEIFLKIMNEYDD